MELKELIKNAVYENFINGSVNNLKITPYFDSSGYSSVIFDFEKLHFIWSVNKNGYICQHEPFTGSNNDLQFTDKEVKNICNIVIKYVSEQEESNKKIISKIAELQSEIDKLRSELV